MKSLPELKPARGQSLYIMSLQYYARLQNHVIMLGVLGALAQPVPLNIVKLQP